MPTNKFILFHTVALNHLTIPKQRDFFYWSLYQEN